MATEYIRTENIIDSNTSELKEAIKAHPDSLVFTQATGDIKVPVIYTANEGILIQGVPPLPPNSEDKTLIYENGTLGWKDKEYIVSMTWPNNPVCNGRVTILGDKNVILDKIHPVLVTTDDNYLPKVVYELDPNDVSKTIEERVIPVTVEYNARNPNSTRWRTFTVIISKDTLSADVSNFIPNEVSGIFNLVKEDGTEITFDGIDGEEDGEFADYTYDSDGEYNGVQYTFIVFDKNEDLPDDPGTLEGFFLTRDAVIDGTIGEVCVLFPELYYRSRQDNVYNTVEFCLNPSNPAEWTESPLLGIFPWMCISRDNVLNYTTLSPCSTALNKELRFGMFSVPIDTLNINDPVNLFGVHTMDSGTSSVSPYYSDSISRSISYTEYKVLWWLVSLAWSAPTILGNYNPMHFENIDDSILETSDRESITFRPKQGVWTDPQDIDTDINQVGIKIVPVRRVYPLDLLSPHVVWEAGSQMMVFKNIQAPFTGVPFFLYNLGFQQTQIKGPVNYRRGINEKWFIYKTEQAISQNEIYIPFYTDASPLQVSPPHGLGVLQYELGSQADILPRTYNPLLGKTMLQLQYYYMGNIGDLWRSPLTDDSQNSSVPGGWVVVGDWGQSDPKLSLWYQYNSGGNAANTKFGLIRCLSRKLNY